MRKMFEEYPLRQNDVELLYLYADKVGVTVDTQEMSEKDGERLLTEVIKDYQNYAISTDDVSTICELIYEKFRKSDSNFFSLFLNGAEISWYVRWSPEMGASFIRDLINRFGRKWEETQ